MTREVTNINILTVLRHDRDYRFMRAMIVRCLSLGLLVDNADFYDSGGGGAISQSDRPMRKAPSAPWIRRPSHLPNSRIRLLWKYFVYS